MFLVPSVSPIELNNPAVSILTVNDETLVPENIVTHYFLLDRYNQNPTGPGISEFFAIDYQTDFGLKDLTAASLHEFDMRLQSEK